MPNSPRVYLAVDVGASSGRVLAGLFDGQRLQLQEVHRFDNGPVWASGRMHWDVLRQWENIQDGLRRGAQRFGDQVRGVGVDTWGVDFALLGRGDELLGNPRHYRDPHTQGILERAFEIVSREEIFAETGLQFMEFNTLYQLLAMREVDSPLLEMATSLLMIPDLFHWLLTGIKTNECTNATTTQFFNPNKGNWAPRLLEKFGVPSRILGPIARPGTRLGRLRRDVRGATGLSGTEVILPGTHDTASAVLAVPTGQPPSEHPEWCYISSGTWSLMGAEIPGPVINDNCRRFNFTNEGGVGETIRLLKNIGGLWLVQECRRVWALAGRDYGWDALTKMAASAKPLVSLVDPDDPSLTAPSDMPEAIRAYCRQTRQQVPESEGAVIRCALESLAMRYRLVLGWLEELTGGPIQTVHIVGGGTNNQQLCQMTADSCNRHVVAGPVEATAIGNVLMQAIAMGDLESIAQARDVLKASFAVQEYQPRNPAVWDEPFARFEALAERARS